MRKTIINSSTPDQASSLNGQWLNVEQVASVEVTSEDPAFPLEGALIPDRKSAGWRAAENGQQTIRIIFDEPRTLRRIQLEFAETERERTQEFTLRWSANRAGPFQEIVRQQWNFNPDSASVEIEDYQVQLAKALVLELTIKPELDASRGFATLSRWRIA